MSDDDHVGTLEQADSGWWYVQCSCGWRAHRKTNQTDPWVHHASHQRVMANIESLQREIKGGGV